MRKIIIGITVLLLGVSLSGCTDTQSTGGEKEMNASKHSKEQATKLVLEKDGKIATVKLIMNDDDLLKELVTIEGDYSSVGEKTKEGVEEKLKEMNASEKVIEGMTSSYELKGDKVIYSKEMDYSKIDLDKLGIKADMMSASGKYPSSAVRIKDYETMGYTKVADKKS